MKTCTKCKEAKDRSCFRSTSKQAAHKDGLNPYCNECIYDYNRNRNYIALYGITRDEYDVLVKAQDSLCAICKQKCVSRQQLCVDHDHTTGKIRGLLCHKCNVALGMLNDDIKLLESAMEYIRSTG